MQLFCIQIRKKESYVNKTVVFPIFLSSAISVLNPEQGHSIQSADTQSRAGTLNPERVCPIQSGYAQSRAGMPNPQRVCPIQSGYAQSRAGMLNPERVCPIQSRYAQSRAGMFICDKTFKRRHSFKKIWYTEINISV